MLSHPFGLATAVATLVLAVLGSVPARAYVVYKVGGDAACPYTSIQAAIDAAGANPGEDYVWIANNQTYAGQQIVVNDQDVDIEGGFTDCNDFDPTGSTTTITGASNGGGAVFTFRGANRVLLLGLNIEGAVRGHNSNGGGIDFQGTGNLQLVDTTVSGNQADFGGGIYIWGDADGATLRLSHDSTIVNNTALFDGGGIRIAGNTTLFVLEANTRVASNHALDGYGGGVLVHGPAQAYIGSPGYLGSAVIEGNDAMDGGGIAAIGISIYDDPVVHLFTIDPANPVQVAGNSAWGAGGAVYLQSWRDDDGFTANAILCANNFRLHDNVASDGSAIYADHYSLSDGTEIGSELSFNTDWELEYQGGFGHPCAPVPGEVACAAGVACNEIRDNIAEDANGQPTQGSAILLQAPSKLIGDRVDMRGNVGAHVLYGIRSAYLTSATLGNCLLATNVTQEVLYGGNIYLEHCTIADNSINASYVMQAENFFDIGSSIVYQPGTQVVEMTGGYPAYAEYVLANDISTLLGPPGNVGIVAGEPAFVDATNGDYHLQPTSIGVDFSPLYPYFANDFDLDGNPRNVDLPDVPDDFGPSDLGAYEIQRGTVVGPIALEKTFTQASVHSNESSTVTLTLDNLSDSTATLNAALTDTLPARLAVAATPNAFTTCAGGSVTADADADSFSLSAGAQIPANQTCSVSVDVSSPDPGIYVNTLAAGALQTDAGVNLFSASATLTVFPPAVPPTLTKAFAPASVEADAPSTLTLTLANGNSGSATLSADLTDVFPPGLAVDAASNATTTCANGTVAANAGDGSFSLSAGAVIPAAGTCTVSVDVSAPASGLYTNTLASGSLETDQGSNLDAASATLTVIAGSGDPIFASGFD